MNYNDRAINNPNCRNKDVPICSQIRVDETKTVKKNHDNSKNCSKKECGFNNYIDHFYASRFKGSKPLTIIKAIVIGTITRAVPTKILLKKPDNDGVMFYL